MTRPFVRIITMLVSLLVLMTIVFGVNCLHGSNRSTTQRRLRIQQGPYYYDRPPQYIPPPYADEIPSNDEDVVIQLPPKDEEFAGYDYPKPNVPFDELTPPMSDDVPKVIHPQYLPSNTRSNDAIVPLQLEVNEMNCYNTPTDGRFHAVLTLKLNEENLPVFEDELRKNDVCVVRSDFTPPRFNTKIKLNVSKVDFQRCGVKNCSVDGGGELLCVRLRFPTLQKMRLPEDAILTLQCTARDRIAAHTKHLNFDVYDSASARSSGAIAKGGNRGELRSKAMLLRKGPNGEFSEVLPQHARVSFGDMLMLKAEIEPDDGWTSSKLSTISMKSTQDLGEELILLQTDGCRSLQAKIICPKDPVTVTPLQHTLLIRAALFEGMQSGEEIKLSVRLIACLEADDCKPSSCSRTQRDRLRRDVSREQHVANSTSEVTFKVVETTTAKNDDISSLSRPNNTPAAVVSVTFVLSAAAILSLVMLTLLLLFPKTKIQICNRW